MADEDLFKGGAVGIASQHMDAGGGGGGTADHPQLGVAGEIAFGSVGIGFEIKKTDVQELIDICNNNAKTLFGI